MSNNQVTVRSIVSIEDLVKKEGLRDFTLDDNKRQVSVDTDLSRFNKGDIIVFVKGKSALKVKEVNGNPAPLVIVFVGDQTRLLYHGTMNRVAVEYKHAQMVGEKAIPTGKTFNANYTDFDSTKKKTLFYQIFTSFENIKDAYTSLINNEVHLKVVDKHQVEVLRFNELVRTRMQSLLCLDFDENYYTPEQLQELCDKLMDDAERSFGHPVQERESQPNPNEGENNGGGSGDVNNNLNNNPNPNPNGGGTSANA